MDIDPDYVYGTMNDFDCKFPISHHHFMVNPSKFINVKIDGEIHSIPLYKRRVELPPPLSPVSNAKLEFGFEKKQIESDHQKDLDLIREQYELQLRMMRSEMEGKINVMRAEMMRVSVEYGTEEDIPKEEEPHSPTTRRMGIKPPIPAPGKQIMTDKKTPFVKSVSSKRT